jgi:hypothetical protein
MLLQRVRGKQQPQVEVRERIDEDSEPLVLPKSNFEKLRDDLERERTPAAERAFYREIARLNGDASIAMKPSTRVKALNKAYIDKLEQYVTVCGCTSFSYVLLP